MADLQIQPHKVTKPIQLVAAWLTGLAIVDGSFLAAAASMSVDSWKSGALVIAAIANVPMFLVAIFLLQTRFRAELQEDSYYSEYLSKRTSQSVKIDKNSEQDARIAGLEQRLLQISNVPNDQHATQSKESPNPGDWAHWLIALNELHPQANAISQALATINVRVASYFGGTNPAEAPSRWVVSISFYMPAPLRIELLRVLVDFEFSGFNFWAPHTEAGENEDVYIGSYGNDRTAPITPRLKTLLARSDAAAVESYYRANIDD